MKLRRGRGPSRWYESTSMTRVVVVSCFLLSTFVGMLQVSTMMKLSLLGSSAVSRFHITDKAAVPLSTLQSAEEGVIALTISESNTTVEENSVVEHNAKANQIAYVISITSCRANFKFHKCSGWSSDSRAFYSFGFSE